MSIIRTEIIPFEPDAVSTAEGKSESNLTAFSSLKQEHPLKFILIIKLMEVTVNQQNHIVSASCSVEQLLNFVLNKPATGIAVAVNQTIVSKIDWSTHLLHPQDQIILIKATQGG